MLCWTWTDCCCCCCSTLHLLTIVLSIDAVAIFVQNKTVLKSVGVIVPGIVAAFVVDFVVNFFAVSIVVVAVSVICCCCCYCDIAFTWIRCCWLKWEGWVWFWCCCYLLRVAFTNGGKALSTLAVNPEAGGHNLEKWGLIFSGFFAQ